MYFRSARPGKIGRYSRRVFLASLIGVAGVRCAEAAPTIVVPPADTTAFAGQAAVVNVTATDPAALHYQWWRGAEPLIGAEGPSYTISRATTADSGAEFRVTVYSSNGSTESRPAHLTVNPVAPVAFETWALAIPNAAKRSPLDAPADDGVPNLLKYALGLPPAVRASAAQLPRLRQDGNAFRYRFSRDKIATGIVATPQFATTLDAAGWMTASDVTKIADDGRVEIWESPLAQTGSRNFTRLTVAVQSPADVAPAIAVQPQGLTVAAGQSATFGVTASGSAALAYQWRRDGVAIRGATAATYTFPVAISADDGARFSVVITNGAGAASSADAVLTVTPAASGTVIYTTDRFHSPINAEIRARLQAVAASNGSLRGDVFMKIGDSITAGTGLLGDFGTGNIDGTGYSWETNIIFASRPDLKSLVLFFRGGKIPAGGTESCLERASLSAQVGQAAGWATQGSPSPLQQEYAVAQPRYAVIMYGSNDIGWWLGGPYGHVYQLTNYQVGMLKIVDECLARGVIPILTTMPPQESYLPQVPYFTAMVRSIAQGRRIPLIDYNRAMMAIGPDFNYGLSDDGVHPIAENYNTSAWLDATSLHYGRNLRNLLTLDALARLKALIVDGAAAPDAIVSRLPGAGTTTDPFRIPRLPFAEFRNTHDSTSASLNGYAGSSVAMPGPEYIYRLVVQSPSRLRLLALDKGANALRLHLLDSTGTPAGCLANDDAMILRDFAPGTYHIVVDSRTATGGEYSLVVLDDAEIPTTVSNLAGTVTTAGTVALSWMAATSNDPIARYALFRGEGSQYGPSFDTFPFAIVDGTTLSWTDTGATAATANYYRIMAIDAAGDAGSPCEAVAVAVP